MEKLDPTGAMAATYHAFRAMSAGIFSDLPTLPKHIAYAIPLSARMPAGNWSCNGDTRESRVSNNSTPVCSVEAGSAPLPRHRALNCRVCCTLSSGAACTQQHQSQSGQSQRNFKPLA